MAKGKGKLTNFLGKIGKPIDGILDVAANLTGVEALDKIGDVLNKNNRLTPEEYAHAMKLAEEDVKDRDSARKMRMKELESEDWFTRNFTNLLSSFVVLAATTFGVLLFFVDVPESNQRTLDMIVDAFFFGGLSAVFGFHLGSSQGSRRKDGILKKLKG